MRDHDSVDTMCFYSDPDRLNQISKYFDRVGVQQQ